jgi:hypothetical protein
MEAAGISGRATAALRDSRSASINVLADLFTLASTFGHIARGESNRREKCAQAEL